MPDRQPIVESRSTVNGQDGMEQEAPGMGPGAAQRGIENLPGVGGDPLYRGCLPSRHPHRNPQDHPTRSGTTDRSLWTAPEVERGNRWGITPRVNTRERLDQRSHPRSRP